ncbi:hypothetical protein [Paraburkholderia sp. 22B1P]|uniref:hypothetical protein n=1 Tax=Paraburkholderia sp. 22B1P TaxID=3080498 RepID=UPI00309187EB|nr:hypothetical protein PBP221_16950 [Paraburkholderia sp. 22B1P]
MDDSAENATEFMLERAAIMEIDGGMKRYDADYYAIVQTWRYCMRTGIAEPTEYRYKLTTRRFTGDEPREPSERTE